MGALLLSRVADAVNETDERGDGDATDCTIVGTRDPGLWFHGNAWREKNCHIASLALMSSVVAPKSGIGSPPGQV